MGKCRRRSRGHGGICIRPLLTFCSHQFGSAKIHSDTLGSKSFGFWGKSLITLRPSSTFRSGSREFDSRCSFGLRIFFNCLESLFEAFAKDYSWPSPDGTRLKTAQNSQSNRFWAWCHGCAEGSSVAPGLCAISPHQKSARVGAGSRLLNPLDQVRRLTPGPPCLEIL